MSDEANAMTDVVVGAGSGMGAEVARLLAQRGRRLVLADRDRSAAEAVAETLKRPVDVVECDVTDADAVELLVGATGALGSLVITAGLSPNMGDARRVVEVNLVAMDGLLRAYEPHLVAGSVAVCFASMAAHQIPADPAVDRILSTPESPAMLTELEELGLLSHSGLAYAVSKRGVVLLVERRAGTWGASGARLLSVSPGVIDTPMGRLEAANEPQMADMVSGSALRREGRPDEVAAVAVFLASDVASFMTGTDVIVDGGVIAQARTSQLAASS
jgi:NAD(P)-dependent dehydrogenase (short-subunit alcohol dehydrogenase family)